MARAPLTGLAREREFHMRDEDFRVIARAMYDHAGIVLGDHKRELVYSRLARRLRRLGLDDFQSYLERLNGPLGDQERNHLINALTTNHTNFFREAHHFDFIRERLVPYWKKRAAETGSKKIRLWSAGCSTGEEPYTLAMVLADTLGREGGWDWKILATDIDTNVLARCKSAEYEAGAIAGIPEHYRKAYVKPVKGDPSRVRLAPQLRSHLVFNRLNLHAAWPIRHPFDAIFCRNVTIYFDGPSKNTLMKRFRGLLRDDACLFLGHSESLLGGVTDMTVAGRTIYVVSGGVLDGS